MKVATKNGALLCALMTREGGSVPSAKSTRLTVSIGRQEFLVCINMEQDEREQFSKEKEDESSDVRFTTYEQRTTATDIDGTFFSLREGGLRDITLTLPDGRRTTFRFSLVAGGGNEPFTYHARWTATSGIHATLTPTGDDRLIALPGLRPFWQAAGLETPMDAFDFPSFVLKTADGTRYVLERQDLGEHIYQDADGQTFFAHAYGTGRLTRILEVSGDSIYLAPNQIAAYNASGELMNTITFTRDSQGRISAITDPNGAQISYGYDTHGDLVSVTDRTGHTVQYVYGNASFPHYLTQIIDPSGHTPLRTQYNSEGRLIGTIDADGNLTQITNNLADHTETIFDRLGNPTLFAYL
jgi:YD repeat-containing protein